MKLSNRLIIILLVLVSVVLICVRTHTILEPLERDLATYAVIAHEMLHGKILYLDLWDHKPPAVHFTYMISEWVLGYGPLSIYTLGVFAALITLIAVYKIIDRYSGGAAWGGLAALWWAIISGDIPAQAAPPEYRSII